MKVKSEREVAQSCLTLCDPMDCSLPGSYVHGIFQARVLEWDAIAFSESSHLDTIKRESKKEKKKNMYACDENSGDSLSSRVHTCNIQKV